MSMISESLNFFIKEDSLFGDCTSDAIFDENALLNFQIISKNKDNFIISGLKIIAELFNNNIQYNLKDGDFISFGDVVIHGTMNAREFLKIERIALNILQNLSSVSTETNKFVNIIKETGVKLLDTRKTSPAMRYMQKYAVQIGGGKNHRSGLYDGILIKDTHIDACGGIGNAINRAKNNSHHLLKIEVECRTFDDVKDAINHNADVIMLDNMNIDMAKKSIDFIRNNSNILIEISGGITKENILQYANLKPDFISTSCITNNLSVVDLSAKTIYKIK